MALQRGTRIGSYEILTLLGAGGMGEVTCLNSSRLRAAEATEHTTETHAEKQQRRGLRHRRRRRVRRSGPAQRRRRSGSTITGRVDANSTYEWVDLDRPIDHADAPALW
jgi:hypothetical protein